MKFGAILFVVACTASASSIFWGHPNVQSNLGEPVLPIGQIVKLDAARLMQEYPQNQIWYTSGLVGYFANEWKAPIWTTPWLDWRQEPEEHEAAYFFQPIVTIPPIDTAPPIVIVPTPKQTENPPPPSDLQPPVPDEPIAILGVPEPGFGGILAVLLLGVMWRSRRDSNPI